MRVPVEWLKEYVDFEESTEEIAELLTMAGLEVGEIALERFGFENSYVCEVVACERHPARDEFFVLKVAADGMERIVLTNLRAYTPGEILPVAFEGYTFPDGSKLEPMKFGGVESNAKIMSEWDIEYSDNREVVLPLPGTAKPGDRVPDALGMTLEVLVFELRANRGDCLCVLGVATELAAVLNRPLKKNVFDVSFEEKERDVEFTVDIRDSELCSRYTGRLLQNIVISDSTPLMKRRLTACGMRPINCIVDVTNYVMLEVGQPLHAFDLDTLENREIIVRRAAEGESIVTIDGADRALSAEMLVIADSSRPVAVAGVMGGLQTEITDATKNMLLESAFFNPRSIRRTASALDMRSEASMRFEKTIPLDDVAAASNYATWLIWKNGWGTPLSGLIDSFPAPKKPVSISVSGDKIRSLTSPDLTDDVIVDALKRLNFAVKAQGGEITATAPSRRSDISIWQDLAEEAARIYGYERITSELPTVKIRRAVMMPNLSANRRLRELLFRANLSEAITFSFTRMEDLSKIWPDSAPEAVPIRNPLTEDQTHLRPSIIPNMLKVVAHNRRNIGDAPIQLFELGRIFFNPAQPSEKDSLVIAVSGRSLRTPTETDYPLPQSCFYTLKGVVEQFLEGAAAQKVEFKTVSVPAFHPHRCAEIIFGGRSIGVMGEVHPEVCSRFEIRDVVALAEIDPEHIKALLDATPRYARISRQPALQRDLSIIVDRDVPAETIADIIRRKGEDLLESARVFDVFTGGPIGEDKKSVSFSLIFRHPDRTLTDSLVAPIIENVIEAIKTEVGGSLRES
jgi:phenylalanyl-tRNA synthetase beta chain